jgi:adenylate cyclase
MAEAKRTLAAILAADVVGYSRLMGEDERATMDLLDICRGVFRKHISAHHGRVVDTAGDSVLATFASVVEAVACAVDVQRALVECNADLADSRRMLFRIGVNLGDVFEKADGSIYGDGVNVAARLESLADPGGVMISDSAHMHVEGKTDLTFQDLGEHDVKNIARPIKAFAWAGADTVSPPTGASAVSEDRKPTVAIGAFEGVGQSEDVAILADGVREAVAASLSNQTGMVTLSDAAAADYVVTARIQGLGNRYRATVRVSDGAAGEHFSSDRFDGEISDLFESQDELAYRIYMSMRYAVYGREGAKTDDRPLVEQSSQALLSQAGLILFGADQAQWLRAQGMLEIVIDREPDDFMALAMISYCHITEMFCGYREIANEDRLAADATARRATRLNEQSDMAHNILSTVLLTCDGDFAAAESEVRRCLELNPYFAPGIFQLGAVHIFRGEAEQGIDLCVKAMEVNPRGPLNHRILWHIALGHFVLERYEPAVAWAKRSDLLFPDVAPTLLILTAAAAQSGQADEAGRAVERLRMLFPEFDMAALRRWPFQDDATWGRFTDGLRKAGLDISEEPAAQG